MFLLFVPHLKFLQTHLGMWILKCRLHYSQNSLSVTDSSPTDPSQSQSIWIYYKALKTVSSLEITLPLFSIETNRFFHTLIHLFFPPKYLIHSSCSHRYLVICICWTWFYLSIHEPLYWMSISSICTNKRKRGNFTITKDTPCWWYEKRSWNSSYIPGSACRTGCQRRL